MNSRHIFLNLLLVLSAILISGCGNVVYQIEILPAEKQLQETIVQKDKGLFVSDKIAMIDVEGTMVNQRQDGLLRTGENPVSVFIEKLDKASNDKDVKAILIRLDSPGGTVVASDIMYHKLQEFKTKTNKPVVICITGMGCSGAYYLASAGDGIIAQPSSVVGNIGVIFQTFSLEGTLNKIGVKTVAIKSGQLKDIASPLHDLKDDEREVLDGVINELFELFKDVVRKGRNLPEQKLTELTDGRVFTAKQALEENLIDKIGYLSDGIEWAKEMANLQKAKVVIYHRPSYYTPNTYSSVSSNASGLESLINIKLPELFTAGETGFLYLWQPGID